jgi:hypothetical protein
MVFNTYKVVNVYPKVGRLGMGIEEMENPIILWRSYLYLCIQYTFVGDGITKNAIGVGPELGFHYWKP